MTDIVEAWLANQQLRRLQKYIERGRPLANASLDELRPRWIALMQAWTDRIPYPVDHSERGDIEAEMQLRRVKPPFDEIKELMAELRRKSREATDEILRDPDRARRVEDDLNKSIEQFEATTKGNKN